MSKRHIEFDLDFEQKDILPKFSIKQFDNALISISTFLRGEPLNPAGNTCKLYVSTGNDVFLQESNIRTLENLVEIDLDKNVISLDGKAFGELELKDGNGTFTSATFIFNIDNKVGEGSTLPNGVEGFIAKHERLIREFKEEINPKIDTINNSISDINIKDSEQDSKLYAVESKNTEQDVRLKDIEYKNKVQDVKLQGLFNENNDGRLTLEGEGNSLKLEGSKKGLVEVNKVVGDTLVNLSNPANKVIGQYSTFATSNLLKPNTVYTAIFWNYGEEEISLYLNPYNFPYTSITIPPKSSAAVVKTSVTELKNNIWCSLEKTLTSYSNASVILVEGDYTNKPIPNECIEGMQSSFEECKVTQQMIDEGLELEENLGKYKCEVEVKGKNLFDGIIEQGSIADGTGQNTSSVDYVVRSTNYTDVKKLNTIKLSYLTSKNPSPSLYLYDSNYNYVRRESGKSQANVVDIAYVRFRLYMSDNSPLYVNEVSNIQIEEVESTSSNATDYEPYYHKTKSVYLNSPLYKNDELIIEDGELKHYHNRVEAVFDGSDDENWVLVNGTYPFVKITLEDMFPTQASLICNTLPVRVDSTDNMIGAEKNLICGVMTTNTPHELRLRPANLSTTLSGCKEWLQQNPTKLNYPLAEPWCETIDTNDFLMEIPNNATISIKSVVPVQSVKATYTANIPSVYGMDKSIDTLQETSVDIIATSWDTDYRVCEIEWTLEGLMGVQKINLSERGVSAMALSRFEQAKIIILGDAYYRPVFEKQLQTYLKRGYLTQEEYDILIAMMDARETIEGE